VKFINLIVKPKEKEKVFIFHFNINLISLFKELRLNGYIE